MPLVIKTKKESTAQNPLIRLEEQIGLLEDILYHNNAGNIEFCISTIRSSAESILNDSDAEGVANISEELRKNLKAFIALRDKPPAMVSNQTIMNALWRVADTVDNDQGFQRRAA